MPAVNLQSFQTLGFIQNIGPMEWMIILVVMLLLFGRRPFLLLNVGTISTRADHRLLRALVDLRLRRTNPFARPDDLIGHRDLFGHRSQEVETPCELVDCLVDDCVPVSATVLRNPGQTVPEMVGNIELATAAACHPDREPNATSGHVNVST